jgi:hypothetical protein
MMYIIMVPLAGDSRDMRFGPRILSARRGQARPLIGEMNVMAKNYVVAVDGAISAAPFSLGLRSTDISSKRKDEPCLQHGVTF